MGRSNLNSRRVAIAAMVGVFAAWVGSTAHAQAPTTPRRRQREVRLARQSVREVVERQSRVVREHSRLLAPEPENDEVLPVAGWEMHDAIDATPCAHDLPAGQVLVQEGARVPRLRGLGRREVAILALGHLEEGVPVR